jgi:F-type H+-transporting ATPase subunit a
MGSFNRIVESLLVMLFFCFPLNAKGETQKNEGEKSETKAVEKFEPGTFIFEHIGDAYSWHIISVKQHEISIPLPVILYSTHSGFHVFFSSKFHHGTEEYNGFKISEEGAYKGKIVETSGSGLIDKPYDFSITKNVTSLFISLGILLWLFLAIARSYRRRPMMAPKGIQSLMEPLILFIRDEVAKPSIGEHKYEKFMPYLLTVFFFIWINNMMGLIPFFPGGANLTGNISITLVLALFTFAITTFSGNKNYWKDIFNTPGVPWWLKVIPIMPFVEFLGMFTKPFALMVRLFANISAGHIIALAFFGLIFIFGGSNPIVGYGVSIPTVLFTVFMNFLELLVAFVQAFVFTLLSAVYLGMAVEEHH